ncbi:MAG: GNAT family N-acetyltransferase [Lachnospiraceae bacterium]|nr:GNAT family N-acetyltransferase [Lachnospiraceae bacterium]
MDNEPLTGPDFTISYADISEWESAMQLAWRTFLKFEAGEYGKVGTKNFFNFISGDLLKQMFLAGTYRLAVAKIEGDIVGIASIRGQRHISLLFVEESFHRQGIGTALLAFLQKDLMKNGNCIMSVNAAPYGVPFYERIGFTATSDLQMADGITFVPMVCLSEIVT